VDDIFHDFFDFFFEVDDKLLLTFEVILFAVFEDFFKI